MCLVIMACTFCWKKVLMGNPLNVSWWEFCKGLSSSKTEHAIRNVYNIVSILFPPLLSLFDSSFSSKAPHSPNTTTLTDVNALFGAEVVGIFRKEGDRFQ